ncbi:MAG: Stk1 family PASTA domain-containing Ser/Thr kinase [Chloroflexota bacterium]|nr:Stk1 family PASTA domain-containing Ser/Thr kinase [Chloroflexota bacterium]
MLDTVLGNRYHLLEPAGEGGMAIVYRADDTVLGRPVAVKVLRQQFAADPEFLARFRQEAHAAAALTHPNIVHVYDVGESGGQQYIVMEYVAGPTLKQIIQQRGALPLAEVLDLGSQVCAAAEAAHRRGMVHRDLKPQNVLVNADGLAKVADFGLAQPAGPAAGHPAVAPSVASPATVFGTAQYLSPEQAQGLPATPASDIYAIGVLLYEMATGRLPFDGGSPEEVARKQIQQAPPPPRLLNEALPAAVEGIILKAMAKDPAARYATARELGSALLAYRQLGEGRTVSFQAQPAAPPVAKAPPAMPSAAGPAVTPRPMPRPAPPAAMPARPDASEGVDWMLAVLTLLTLACVLGLIPLGLTLRAALTPPAPTAIPERTVPNLVGLTFAEADSRLRDLGLTLERQGERFDDKVPAGRVVAQTIPSDTQLKWGDAVGVVVSKGVETNPAPNVTGLPFADAQGRLTRLGLAVTRRDAPSAVVALGLVISQAPPASTPLARGAVVTVTVSMGNKILLPDLMGKSEEDAQQAIRSLGLQTTYVNYQKESEIPHSERWRLDVVKRGCVLSQSPEAGKLVDPGTTVYLAVRRP